MTDFEEFKRKHRTEKAFDEQRCLAFYRWCLKQAEAVVADDMLLLRHIPNLDAYAFVKRTENFSDKERLDILRPLIRDAHSAALSLSGELLTETEMQVVKDYRRKAELWRTGFDDMTGRYATGNVVFTSGKVLGKLLIDTLIPVLGKPERDKSGLRWIFETPVTGMCVRTSLEVKNRVPMDVSIRYGHSLQLENPTFAPGVVDTYQRLTNYLAWNGLGNADWNVADERMVEAVAQCVEQASQLFLGFASEFATERNVA